VWKVVKQHRSGGTGRLASNRLGTLTTFWLWDTKVSAPTGSTSEKWYSYVRKTFLELVFVLLVL